jgi:ribonuclease HI
VIRDADGLIIDEHGERIGDATNNVAEYRALIRGIQRASELGATELDLVGDSELVVKQVQGAYKVKNAGIKPLHAEAKAALEAFRSWTIRHVRREQNAEADRLVNEVLDG